MPLLSDLFTRALSGDKSAAAELGKQLDSLAKQVDVSRGKVGYPYVPRYPDASLSENSGALAGEAVNVGSYTIGPLGSGADYTFDYPASAKVINVRLVGRWAAIADANIAYVIPNGGAQTDGGVQVKAYVATWGDPSFGLVSLDTDALAQLVVVTANMSGCALNILGYC
jgi:hypothetical protein